MNDAADPDRSADDRAQAMTNPVITIATRAEMVSSSSGRMPALVASAGERAGVKFLEFFASIIRNPHTRRAYSRAVADFLAWCVDHGVTLLQAVQPLHVATWIEERTWVCAAPTVKQQLAAIRHLFDWLVIGQVVPLNPAASVRGPAHSVRKGKTPVLDAAEARSLLDSIDISTPIKLRDRALIALMVFSFGQIGAALAIRVEDLFVQNRRLWLRLREKGVKLCDRGARGARPSAPKPQCASRRMGSGPMPPSSHRIRRARISRPKHEADAGRSRAAWRCR